MKLGILKADTLGVYSSSGETPYSALQSGIYLSLANFPPLYSEIYTYTYVWFNQANGDKQFCLYCKTHNIANRIFFVERQFLMILNFKNKKIMYS